MNNYMLVGYVWIACGVSLLISAGMVKHPGKATYSYGIVIILSGIVDFILGVIK